MNIIKKITAVLLIIAVFVSMCGCSAQPEKSSSDKSVYGETIDKTAAWLTGKIKEPEIGSTGGEWLVIGLSRSGVKVPDGYFEKYYQKICDYTQQNNGVLDTKIYTEYSRVILALTAIGKNPADVEGYNLLVPLADFEMTVYQGISGPVYALLALDSAGYEIPENIADSTQATRQMYIDYILSKEAETGGWAVFGSVGDVDMTAMVLLALAGYIDQPEVAQAVERALEFISQQQNDNGGFVTNGTESSETISQVIMALVELGISPEDARFVKNGNTLYKRLQEFMMSDGSFCHTLDAGKSNLMATEQAFCAVVAINKMAEGKSSLYKMS